MTRSRVNSQDGLQCIWACSPHLWEAMRTGRRGVGSDAGYCSCSHSRLMFEPMQEPMQEQAKGRGSMQLGCCSLKAREGCREGSSTCAVGQKHTSVLCHEAWALHLAWGVTTHACVQRLTSHRGIEHTSLGFAGLASAY